MNEYEKELMKAPSLVREWCVVCGRPATNLHHVVYRSHGGKDSPLVSLCGFGNASGCHGLVHHNRIHFRYTGRWEYLMTDEPVKIDVAYESGGWLPCST